ncbi:MAG: ribonuclease P protein component 4 [Nanobdellota archaeon]
MVKKPVKKRYSAIKDRQNKIAKNHVRELYNEQRKQLYSDKKLAQRYSDLIRRISMKFRLKLPREVKHSYCKHCKTVFIPGENCRIRLQGKKVVYYCFECKNYTRLPYWKR